MNKQCNDKKYKKELMEEHLQPGFCGDNLQMSPCQKWLWLNSLTKCQPIHLIIN